MTNGSRRMDKLLARRVCVLLAAVGIALPAVRSFPSGGPFIICADPYPHHEHMVAQTTDSPFEIVLEPSGYAPGDLINVTMRAKVGLTPLSFNGYQIAAHALSGRWDQLHGGFAGPSPNSIMYKYYSDEFNCVTHSSNARNEVVNLVWKAPALSAGDIIFSATVLVDFHTFWVNVSALLSAKAHREPSADLIPLQQVQIPSRFPQLTGCGTEVGCLLWPRYCTSFADCDFAVTYQAVNSSSIKFQLSGRATGFLSLGVSLDKKMDKDETLSCLSTDGRLSYQHGYNPDYYNARVTEDSVSQISIRQEDGFLFCEFVRPVAVNVTAYGGRHKKSMVTELFDLQQPNYHLYLGWGAMYPGSQDSMMKHDELPLVSGRPINFFDHESAFFNAIPLDIQIHATLMLVAWMGCVSIASTVARYSRSQVFGRKKLCGQAAWFQVHRGMLIAAAALVLASLVLVFVSVRGWTRVATIHASFGIVSCALMIMQVIAGLCRPSPTSSRRLAFSWIHRIGGITAWLCAAVSSVLGANVSYFPARIASWGTAVLGAWIGCQLVVVVLFEVLRCIRARSEVIVVNLQDASMTDSKEGSKNLDETAAVRTFLMLFYICCTVGLLAAAVAMIWFY